MRWHVKGSHAQTGKTVAYDIVADSEVEAMEKAKKLGFVPKMVEQLPDLPPPPLPLPQPVAQPVAFTARSCPVCGSTAPPIRKAKGSIVVLIILLLLWIVPGLLYLIFASGHVFKCPTCGAKIADA